MLILLTANDIVDIHDGVIEKQQLQGLAGDKSLEGMLGRIDFRLKYGSIKDIFDLSALYAVIISQGHIFSDANKRTAFSAMDICLYSNGSKMKWDMKEIADIIIEVAQGNMDEVELAMWLREKRSDRS